VTGSGASRSTAWDLRQYTVADAAADGPVVGEGGEPPDDGKQGVLLNLNAPEPDIQEMIGRSAAQYEAMNARVGLLMWAVKVFGREEGTPHDPAQWRQRRHEARAVSDMDGSDEEYEPGRGGPGFVAAVCLRDHWEEMSGDERDWCVNVISLEVERDGDNWNHLARMQRSGMSGDRLSAWVLSALLGKSLDDRTRRRVLKSLSVALTHAVDEVRAYAASGVGSHLWVGDRELALRCVNALATEATLVQQAIDTESERPYPDRRQIDEIAAEAAALIRCRFEANPVSSDAHQTFDPTGWVASEANSRILTILGQAPSEPAATAAFRRLASVLVKWWDGDDEHDERRGGRNHQAEPILSRQLEDFLLRAPAAEAATILQPILEAVGRHPREVSWILEGLISIEDLHPATPQFWLLWGLFADKVRDARWLTRIDAEHAHGREMIAAIFLGSWWKADVRHWRSREGYADHVHSLFEDLPVSSTVLGDYVRFLYHIGEQSLPGTFIRIAKRLRQGEPGLMLRDGNTIFMLEMLLQRHVYGRPLELKRQPDLRSAVLELLDMLVESGSSGAFRMRDDFVTPAPIQ